MTTPRPEVPSILTVEFQSQALDFLRTYYTATTTNGRPSFSGSRFETIGYPWDDPAHAHHITADDLVSLACLSVPVPGHAAVRLLETQADEITDCLREMPDADVNIWEAEDQNPLAAGDLWSLLRSGRDQIGPTSTSKLMARKRAALIPIYDSVVADALGLKNSVGHWAFMREMMLLPVGNGYLHQHLENLIKQVDVEFNITALRAFDVIVWQEHNSRSKGPSGSADK